MRSQMEKSVNQLIGKYSAFEVFAKVFNPDIQSVLLCNLEKAYLSDAPSIGVMTETYGIDACLFWIKTQILSIDFYAGQKKDADESALNELVRLIARKYKALKVTEFPLFVARFKLGEYGRFYGSFDPMFVGESIRKFEKERQLEIEKLSKESEQRRIEERRFIPPDGYTSLSWVRELRQRAEQGDEEAIKLLQPPKT